jgi:hypothetical protein
MNRRDLISIAMGIPAIYGISKYVSYKSTSGIQINLHYRGMAEGHLIRDGHIIAPEKQKEIQSDVCVIGSGISGLTCCWKLLSSGYKGNIVLVTGGELFGNSSDIKIENSSYPTGAHYLPLQNEESFHTRELLKFFDIIKSEEFSLKPNYNENHLVFSPMERVLYEKEWTEGLYKKTETSVRFFEFIDTFKNKIGSDGKKLFSIPLPLSSIDGLYLDKISFKDWLIENNYIEESLWDYLDYCCRDDYGTNISITSAWAGIHYFAGRTGKCANMEEETILTWKNGNAFLAQKLFDYIRNKITVIEGSAYKYSIDKKNISVANLKNAEFYSIKTKNTVFATPLNIINHICDTPILKKEILPDHSVWVISNFLLKELPREKYKGIGLSYDNVVFPSTNLGYVFSDNQSMDISRDKKVLTTYTCLSDKKMLDSRKQLISMNKQDLFDLAIKDLLTSYGEHIYSLIESVDINIRGHAMPYPNVGFLYRNKSLQITTQDLKSKRIFLAHADLSGISIFEEASWWGYKAALDIIA